jgi:uncharacterized membrane protein YfcA
MTFVKAFFRFWYDFIIGDDWKIAAAVVIVLLAGAVAVLAGAGGAAVLPLLLAIGIGAAFTTSLLIDTRPRR